MRKGALFHWLIIFLLVIMLLNSSSSLYTSKTSNSLNKLETGLITILSNDSSGLNLTWTSRTQQIPQFVENNSIAAGDHVVVNGIFAQALNVTQCKLTILDLFSGINVSVNYSGSSIAYDTYYLSGTNQPYTIIVNGTTNTNDFVIIYRENVTICNFFVPTIIMNAPVSNGNGIWNLTWSSTDQNADDVPYYSVWLSGDAGVTFVLLQQNLTVTNYTWDSSSWFEADYMLMLRAYSVDLTSDNCGLDNPPRSYWPGDRSDAFSYLFHAGVEFLHIPPSFSINTHWLTYEHGSSGNTILVQVNNYDQTTPSSSQYSVRDNGSLWREGVYESIWSSFSFSINIDGLSLGLHDLSISLSNFGYYEHLTVIVSWLNADTINIPQEPSSFIQGFTTGISLGSITIIALVIILSLRLKRNPTIEYIEEI